MNIWKECCKEKLGRKDRRNVPQVKLRVNDENVRASFCKRPYDTPFHLREIYEKEVKKCLEVGQIVPCGAEPSKWASKAFPFPKGASS